MKRLGDKKEVKSIIFVPHTRDSKLARMLRNKETKIEVTTRDKVKIVERGGRKIEDIIANKDPWKNKDCGRPNCFICMTKTLRKGNKNKDCTKRNINYEIKCLTCEKIEKGRREEEAGDDVEKTKELEEKMKTPIYIGETSQSGYERGFEKRKKKIN